MKAPSNGLSVNTEEGEKKNINSELWHACAGPLVSLPPVGSLVVYFPQGHSEQVAATMQKETDSIPNYPSLPSKLICMLHNVILHADTETDEVYAQMTLQPVNKFDKDAVLASDLGLKQSRQPTEFFCKTLTASDTSTHGGFSVPRRAAEKIFPPLDFSMQPPAQELVAKDLHDVTWTFRHVYRGQPKRHLLTTGWSVFVSTKRLLAGDSVLFIRDEKGQLLLGIRRANRQQPALSSSVLSSDSMHIGILAAAAHAAANNSPYTIFYNPRASPSEFVIPLAKYNKAMYTQVSLGMRFRMMFETEESGVRRYMGTITGISDVDPVRWKNSQWRSLQVGWDESTAGERQNRVSIWEIEPVATPFYICPPPFFRPKLPKQPGMPEDENDIENSLKQAMPWLGDATNMKDAQNPLLSSMNLVQWMNMQRNPQMMASASQSPYFSSMIASLLQNNIGTDDHSRLLSFQTQSMPLPTNLQFSVPKPVQQIDGFQQSAPIIWSQLQQQQQQTPQQLLIQQQQQQVVIQSPQQLQSATILSPQQFPQSILNPQQQQQQQQQPITLQPQQQTQVHPQQLNPSLLQQQLTALPSLLQQKQIPSPTHPPTTPHLQTKPQNHQSFPQQRQPQDQPPQQSHPPQIRSSTAPTGIVEQRKTQPFVLQSSAQLQPFSNQMLQSTQSPVLQTAATSSSEIQKIPSVTNLGNLQQVAAPQNLQFQQQLELCHGLSPNPHQQTMPSQTQLQLLQKLQQQQQLLSQLNPQVLSQLTQPQLALQQNQLFQQKPVAVQQPSGSGVQLSNPQKDVLLSGNIVGNPVKAQLTQRDPSTVQNVEAPTCSTSPYNTFQVSSTNLLNRGQPGSGMHSGNVGILSGNNIVQELSRGTDTRVKTEVQAQHCGKDLDNVSFRNSMPDQLEASSSATSFCMDKSGEESFSLPPICLDGEVQVDTRDHMFGAHIDGITPDTLLSRGFSSGKDLQNLLSGYGNQKDLDTEISTAAISSQSFGLPDLPFKPGYLNDAVVNDNGALNRGPWSNQPHRMRTYTKVQKRGSVGRSIDVTRYRGYEDLRHDLACMFGIDGQLEDPHRSDWKLVYVDHENDILLVGDDPWEEFVNCVQSIKILSAAEVQQMSLEGDLGGAPIQNEACSGSDYGNIWRGHSFAG